MREAAGGRAPFGRPAARAFGVAAAIVIIDQITKLWAVSALELYRSVEILPFFNLTLLHNTGAAFSFLADAGGWQRWFFVVLTIVIATGVAIWLTRLTVEERITRACLALILGGAIGNLIDRIRLGYVIDFLDFHAAGWHWPAFNVADAAISCGAVMLVVFGLLGRS
jgi:signal peptidase II